MSLTPLDNPLERLGVLPNAMNWRGGWTATEQFYLNDVVVAPANNSSYILTGRTTLLGGLDPTLNAEWEELSSATTGVNNVAAGVGISLTGTPTNVIVNNDGVITATAGAGITVGGTAQNPIITNSGVVSVVAGAGIGATVGSNPTISNTGVLTVTAGGGIGVTAGQNPSISNSGILTLTAGTGITITAGQNPTIAATSFPRLSLIQCQNFAGVNPAAAGQIIINNASWINPSAIYNDFDDGAPDPNGTWLVDFSAYKFMNVDGVFAVPAPITISLVDTPNAATYVLSASEGGAVQGLAQCSAPAQPFGYGLVALNVAAIRATGFRFLTSIQFTNTTTGTYWVTTNPQTLFCQYFPNGVQ